jgi:hypothetical protein
MCHSGTAHYRSNYGDTHGRTQICTNCHKHDKGFAGAGHSAGADCKGCHNTAQGTRPAIQPEFERLGAHIDNSWANIASTDCERCHDETTSDGIIKLKLWGTNAPTGSTITYDATNLYNNNGFCLSCHDADTNATGIDMWTGLAGTQTPTNINTRWAYDNTKLFSKFSTANYNVVPQITKSYSPHRFPGTNDTKGTTDMTTYRYNAARAVSNTAPVACLDCHPSHGSNVVSGAKGNYGAYTNYNTSTGAKGGVMIRDSRPTGTAQAYTKEEEMCWDCHNLGMDFRGDQAGGTLNRWGAHNGTNFTATWGTTSPFPFKQAKTFDSSHFYPDKPLTYQAGSGFRNRNNTSRTNLSCSTCHEPHGINGLTDNAFRLPILRGTWLTSPYFEDRPPSGATADTSPSPVYYNWKFSTSATFDMGGSSMGARISPEFSVNKAPNYGQGYGTSGGGGANGYFIDENTFGTRGGWKSGGADPHRWGYWASSANRTNWANGGITIAHFNDNTSMNSEGVALDNTKFQGLCAACHAFPNLYSAWNGHIVVPGVTGSWANMFQRPYMAQMQRVGTGGTFSKSGNNWGDLTADQSGFASGQDPGYKWGYSPIDNTSAQSNYHRFPCSKCHTPHASILPRLMISNCLDVGNSPTQIKNLLDSAAGIYPYPQTGTWNATTEGLQAIPTAYDGSTDAWALAVTCHADTDGPGNDTAVEGAALGTPGAGNFNGTKGWNRVTPW